MDYQEDDFETRMANYTFHEPIQPLQPLPTREYGIVLCGMTGSGKSATGNTIIGRKVFTSESSGQSVTDVSSYAESKYGDHTITVVDTPGIHDNIRTDSEIKMEIARMAFLLREGVHCFVICMNASDVRVTNEKQQFLEAVKVSGHADFFDYCMLVYTKPESELCDTSLNNYLKKQKENKEMNLFLEKIGDRVLAVNNKARDRNEKKRNKDAIIAMVQKVIQNNQTNGKPIAFTNDAFEKATQMREKVVSLVARENCHPSLVNAVVEAVIRFSKWGAMSEKKFVEKVIGILCESDQCEQVGTNLVFKNDGVITIPFECCEEHITMIYVAIQSHIGPFYKMLGTILNHKKTYLITTGAATVGAGVVAGATGIAAVGVILGVPAVVAFKIGAK